MTTPQKTTCISGGTIVAYRDGAHRILKDGVAGYPVFDPMDNSCVPEALSCIMGRPSTEEDVILCNLLIAQAKDDTDLITKKNIAVATFLAAAHTCE